MKVWGDFLGPPRSTDKTTLIIKVSKVAKIRNRYNQVPHLTQDTNGKVTNSQKTPQTRVKRSALSLYGYDLYVLGDDALISKGSFMQTNIYVS